MSKRNLKLAEHYFYVWRSALMGTTFMDAQPFLSLHWKYLFEAAFNGEI
jgi:hypothetical protein